ncbi:MAG: hypothetical protein M1434_13165 [Chloroflexi bacterium]|nr:hypothetical protein [Chloroflexota bacterium]MCL5275672.1 hypothetical protein [Chloroflexota bacterium]
MNTQLARMAFESQTSVYVNSAPNDGRWVQPPASYYYLTVINGVMQGQPITGVHQPLSSNLPELTESVRSEMLTAMEIVLHQGAEVWKELARR